MKGKETALKSVKMFYSCPSHVLMAQVVPNFVKYPNTFFSLLHKPESISVNCSQTTLIRSSVRVQVLIMEVGTELPLPLISSPLFP